MKGEKKLLQSAKEKGASLAKLVSVEDIVVDPRVRMKCRIPLCSQYNNNLMCPPFAPTVEEFEESLKKYEKAIFIQVEADINSLDRETGRINEKIWADLEEKHMPHMRKLNEIVGDLEAEAFKMGFHLAIGLIGGACPLCETCVAEEGGDKCRHPFSARPSMEAVGIDVYETCKNLGIPLGLSSHENVRWNGLVLLE